MRAAFLMTIGALASSCLVACGDAAPDAGGADATSSTATAIVVVERTAGPGDAVRGDSVTARFVRVRQGTVDDLALRMAGIADDVPLAGTCVAPSDTMPAIQGRSVELLDVGQMVLTNDSSKSTVLLPRSMPDPAGVVSGVLYSSQSAEAFGPGSRLSLRATGGMDVADGFNVSVTAPREVAGVRVTPTPTGLDVTWEPLESDARDLVYVDVVGPSARVTMRCAAAEAGHVFVPVAQVGLDDGPIAVHRLHKETFRAKGIEPGEVRFDMVKLANVRREP